MYSSCKFTNVHLGTFSNIRVYKKLNTGPLLVHNFVVLRLLPSGFGLFRLLAELCVVDASHVQALHEDVGTDVAGLRHADVVLGLNLPEQSELVDRDNVVRISGWKFLSSQKKVTMSVEDVPFLFKKVKQALEN
jgi:hypothetical protein